jgi:ABC-type polysaccharide/polyol phosphate export permease
MFVGDSDVAWIENAAIQGRRHLDARELWAYRELALFLAQRDLKVRYRQAVFGVLWAVIQPLAGVVVAVIVFHRVARVSSGDIPYALFAYAGFVVWSYFSSSLDGATASLVANSSLVTKVYFPRLIAPLAAVLPRLVDLGVSLALLVILAIAYGVAPGAAVVLLPVWIAWAVVLAFGTGLALSALNVTYRDVANAIGLVIQLWLFLSPVMYPSSLVSGAARAVYAINPMVAIVDGFRWSILGAPAPPAADLLGVVTTVVVLLVGVRYFLRVERRFADVI